MFKRIAGVFASHNKNSARLIVDNETAGVSEDVQRNFIKFKYKLADQVREYLDALVTGEFTVRVYKNGRCIDTFSDHNLIVTLGRKRFAELIAGTSTAPIKYIGIGTGSAAADVKDSSLREQQLFEVTSSTVYGCDAVFKWNIDTSQANGVAIREFGLFTSDRVMITHRVRLYPINKDDDMELEGEYRLKF